jgi:serine/threonine-protein kinase HipA
VQVAPNRVVRDLHGVIGTTLGGRRPKTTVMHGGQLRIVKLQWCGADGADVLAIKRELWRRMAFNALCGNGDDHPRNHGALCIAGHWALAPAYDIAPYISFGESLAMSITRDGHMQAARWALLRDCETFGYTNEEGAGYIDQAIRTMTQTWDAERAALGFKADDAPTPTPEKWLSTPPPAGLAPRRRPRTRRR